MSIIYRSDKGSNLTPSEVDGNFEFIEDALSVPRIALYDTTTQSIAVINTAQVITFNTLDETSGITQTSSSRFTITEAGRYTIIGKAQINLVSSPNKFLNIWTRKNGNDIALSNSRMGVVSANADLSLPLLVYVECEVGDYLEMWMAGDSTGLQLATVASAGGAPVTNSIVMVILKTGV